MAINRTLSTILDILINKKGYESLNNIHLKLKEQKINISQKTMQREMKKLTDTNRVTSTGQASTTEYIIDEIQRAYPSAQYLYIYKNNIIIGQFFKLKDRYRFYYDSEYLSLYTQEIPTIKLSVAYTDYENIPAVFEENIPEGINRELLEATHKISDEFEILSLLDDNIGDICFSETKEKCYIEDEIGSNYLGSLDTILGSNTKINVLENFTIDINEKELFPDNYDLSKVELKQTHGISGFQYKKLVNIDFKKKIIATNAKAHEYILKPFNKQKANQESNYYFPHISLNEHLHISFAKNELGFKVPYSAIIKSESDEEYHYIVKRFDRLGVHRFAKFSFAVFLGLRSENKYDTTSEKMFKRIAKELISPQQRMELLKHYVYSSIIVHEDLHTKNLSLIYEKGKTIFAPLYDVCCTGLYDTTKGYESTLTINGKQMKIRPNDYKGLCKILKIDFKEFKKEASKIATIYRDSMPLYFTEIKKLGSIPFYRKVFKTKRGNSDGQWTIKGNAIEFFDVLESYHKKRIQELVELGWIV